MRVMFIDSNPVMISVLPKGFQDAGFEVNVTGSIASKQQLESQMELFQPHLVLTNGWGNEQTHEKQGWIRECVSRRKIPHVYWSVEDPLYTDYFVVPLVNIAKPDFIFTISPQHVAFYRSLGFASAHLDWGIHPNEIRPTAPDPDFAVDIALIANSYYDTIEKFDVFRIESMRRLLIPLIKADIRVDIWGQGWEHMEPVLGVKIPDDWLRGPLPYLDCNKVYASSNIVLGLQNLLTQVTQRTYEVLAAGGFLLTSDTPAVRKLFQPDMHLAVSDSPKQTIATVNKYLKDAALRKQVGDAGRVAVQDHNYVARVGYIMDTITRAGVFRK